MVFLVKLLFRNVRFRHYLVANGLLTIIGPVSSAEVGTITIECTGWS